MEVMLRQVDWMEIHSIKNSAMEALCLWHRKGKSIETERLAVSWGWDWDDSRTANRKREFGGDDGNVLKLN